MRAAEVRLRTGDGAEATRLLREIASQPAESLQAASLNPSVRQIVEDVEFRRLLDEVGWPIAVNEAK